MAKLFVGADIGGTTVKIGVFCEKLLKKWEIPTRKESDGDLILKDIWQSIQKEVVALGYSPSHISAIGFGVPGPVIGNSVVNKCVNLGWGVKDLAQEMSNHCSLPIVVGNDANLAALGEVWKGAAEAYSSVVMVTLGTGVGGGIVMNGRILSGSAGSAGEIGHICVNPPEKKPCSCGLYGCLEQYASATGIVRLAEEVLAQSDCESVLRSIEKITAKDVLDAAKTGDALGYRVFEQMCDYLGKALASVGDVINPEAFVIGGGVSKSGDFLLPKIKENYVKYAFHAVSNVEFKIAQLGNDAGIYGAVKLAMDIYH